MNPSNDWHRTTARRHAEQARHRMRQQYEAGVQSNRRLRKAQMDARMHSSGSPGGAIAAVVGIIFFLMWLGWMVWIFFSVSQF